MITKTKVMSKQIEAINLNDRQTVYLTANAPSVKAGLSKVGDKASVHPKRAESMIKASKASAEPLTTTKSKEK